VTLIEGDGLIEEVGLMEIVEEGDIDLVSDILLLIERLTDSDCVEEDVMDRVGVVVREGLVEG
jgi:hypothetical protein